MESLAPLGQIIAALAVVILLGYLLIQIRNKFKQARGPTGTIARTQSSWFAIKSTKSSALQFMFDKAEPIHKNTRLLIEGWRGINHSYALVNQYQMLELSKLENISLFHKDMPFVNPAWNSSSNWSGFDKREANIIQGIREDESQQYDVIYRIDYPFRITGVDGKRVFCFGTSEYQFVEPAAIANGANVARQYLCEGAQIITPSNWSKAGFVKFGFKEADVMVVPHGVDPGRFFPLTVRKRSSARKQLNLSDESFVFLNIGSMGWHKGTDLLIEAFSHLRQRYPFIVCLLKDQSNLYGVTGRDFIGMVKNKNPAILNNQALSSIRFLSENLDHKTLRTLYSAADAYISPYRAEGFNLTPLEAAACGTPILVTDGGPTDDYFHESLGRKIQGDLTQVSNETYKTYIEPSLDSLICEMDALIDNRGSFNSKPAVDWVRNNYSWEKATRKLAGILTDDKTTTAQ